MTVCDNVLEVTNLTKSYRAQAGIYDLSFTIAKNSVVGLLGPNGAGKSTTLHCLVGILQQTSGSILLSGFPHTEEAAKEIFGFLPDDLPLPDSLRLREVLLLHRRLRPKFDDALADSLIDLVSLKEHAAKYIGEYSHGMRKKLQLVTALAHRPRLLILDEPMRGLDPESAILLRSVLKIFTAQGGATLYATHDLQSAETYCDQVIVLSAGRIIAQGSPAELINETGADGLEDYFIRAAGLTERIHAAQSKLTGMKFVDN